jgi:tRNA A37 threonylcarbamoyladenosine dehydratase
MADNFIRTELLLGSQGMERLKSARVAIFGLGAVGGFALEALVRSGVGEFLLVDFDEIRSSNLNRQILATTSTLHCAKAQTAKARALSINPQAILNISSEFADARTLPGILTTKPDLIIDAIDSLNPKVDLLVYAVTSGIAIVSSMGAAHKMDPSAVHTDDISKSRTCPFARIIRKRLGRRGIRSGIRCVYSTEPKISNKFTIEEEDFMERGRKRGILGSMCHITGIFGLTAAGEGIRLLLGNVR